MAGDETEQERLETLCEEFQPAYGWAMRKNDINNIVSKCRNVPAPVLVNPNEGQPACWQLGETAEDFVRRVPPRSTSRFLYEWIWVHNPYAYGHEKFKAPNEYEFTIRGQELLARSLQTRKTIEADGQKKTRSTIIRCLNEESTLLQQRISDLAVQTNVLYGKVNSFASLD